MRAVANHVHGDDLDGAAPILTDHVQPLPPDSDVTQNVRSRIVAEEPPNRSSLGLQGIVPTALPAIPVGRPKHSLRIEAFDFALPLDSG